MGSRKDSMQDIFDKLSEKNKDIIILIAKSIKAAQEEWNREAKTSK